jgi:FkbM family methyltransferase
MIGDMVRRARPGTTFLDIGAYIGTHSVAVGLTSDAAVHAFEPCKESFDNLTRNVALNELEHRTTLHNVALFSRDDSGWLRILDPTNRGHATVGTGRDRLSGACQRVMLKPLDEFVFEQPVGCMKIDVEGSEEAVLAGAAELIEKDRPLIYCEVGDSSRFGLLACLLARHDYVPIATFNYTPTCLFQRRDELTGATMLAALQESARREVASAGRIQELDALDQARREHLKRLCGEIDLLRRSQTFIARWKEHRLRRRRPQ